MDKKQFATFAAALKTYYPRETLIPNNQAMELWFRQLQDIPYEVAEAGLNKWVATNKWSPSIADIREMATTVTEGDIPDWGNGWEQVLAAIRNYGSYNIKAAMESFDNITRQCVERIGYRNICMSENISTERANFRMIYENLAQRQQKDRLIPEKLKMLISGMQSERIEKNDN